MGPAEPPPPRSGETPRAGANAGAAPADDPLERLRERIRATQEAAERLANEASAQRQGPPPPGHQAPPRGRAGRDDTVELQALVALVDLVRSAVPRELQHQLAVLVRELLLAVRALIDWYLERLDGGAGGPVEVEDIPID